MNLNLRVLKESDTKLFQKVRLQALKAHPEAFGASFEDEESSTLKQIVDRLAPSPNRFVIGAFRKESLIGFCGFYQHSGAKCLHKGTIWGLYVIPEARGHHLGHKLIETVLDLARQCRDLEEVSISVTVGNDYVRKLYTSLGFTHAYLEPHYLKINGHYFDAEYLILML